MKYFITLLFLFIAVPCSGSELFQYFAGSSAASCDGNFPANTKLYIPSNNPDGSTAIVDASGNGHVLTVNGNCDHSSDQAKVGHSSVFIGTDDIDVADNAAFDIGLNDDFVISSWVYLSAVDALDAVYSIYTDANDEFLLWHQASVGWNFYSAVGGSTIVNLQEGSVTMSTGAWNHIVATRVGGDINVYLNASSIASASGTPSVLSNQSVDPAIGSYAGGNDWNGYLDEFLYMKGTGWSQADVTAYYNSGSPDPLSSTCWPKDGVAQRVKLTAGTITGTLSNMTNTVVLDASVGSGNKDMTDYITWICGSDNTGDRIYNQGVTTDDEYTGVPLLGIKADCTNDRVEIKHGVPSVATGTEFWLYYDGYTPDPWAGSVDYNEAVGTLAFKNDTEIIVAFPMGEGAATIRDWSGNSYDASGVSLSSADVTTGVVGDAILFDGTNDYMTIDSIGIFPTNNVSIYCWANTDDDTAIRRMFTTFEDTYMRFEYLGTTTDKLSLHVESTTPNDYYVYSDSAIAADTWTHFGGTFTNAADGLKAYIDGSAETTPETPDNVLNGYNLTSTIGADFDGGSKWSGMIDECRAYSDVRTAAEISFDYSTMSDTGFSLGSIETATPTNVKISNGDIYDSYTAADANMSSTSWTDADGGDGTTTANSFQSFDSWDMDSGATTGGGEEAAQTTNIGAVGSRTVASFRVYHEASGTHGANDMFRIIVDNSTWRLILGSATDGIYVHDGVAYQQVTATGNLICSGAVTGCWLTYTLDLDWSTQTVDIWMAAEGEPLHLVLADVDFSIAGIGSDGDISIYQYGQTNGNRISHLDWIKFGSDFVNQ